MHPQSEEERAPAHVFPLKSTFFFFFTATTGPRNSSQGAGKHFLIIMKQTFCGSIFGGRVARLSTGSLLKTA